jgi:hypothetical protein
LRELRLTRGFFISCKRYVAPGSSKARAVARILRELEDEALDVPAASDEPDLLPPAVPCWGRRVAGTTLVVCYTFKKGVVCVRAVKVG